MLSFSIVFINKISLLSLHNLHFLGKFFKKAILKNTSEQLLLYWLFYQIQIIYESQFIVMNNYVMINLIEIDRLVMLYKQKFPYRRFVLYIKSSIKTAYRRSWALDAQPELLDPKTPGCLDSGRLDSGRLDAWTLEAWILHTWSFGPCTLGKQTNF